MAKDWDGRSPKVSPDPNRAMLVTARSYHTVNPAGFNQMGALAATNIGKDCEKAVFVLESADLARVVLLRFMVKCWNLA